MVYREREIIVSLTKAIIIIAGIIIIAPPLFYCYPYYKGMQEYNNGIKLIRDTKTELILDNYDEAALLSGRAATHFLRAATYFEEAEEIAKKCYFSFIIYEKFSYVLTPLIGEDKEETESLEIEGVSGEHEKEAIALKFRATLQYARAKKLYYKILEAEYKRQLLSFIFNLIRSILGLLA